MIGKASYKSTLSVKNLLLELAIICSVFSQIESVERVFRFAMYIMWILVLLFGLAKQRSLVHINDFSKTFIFAYLLFVLFCLLRGFIDNNFLTTNYLRVLLVPLMVTISGDIVADDNIKTIDKLCRVYLICALIFAVWVQRTYFTSYSSWLVSRRYIFSEKNSAGQIWSAAIFISIFLLHYKSRLEKTLIYMACMYLLIMIGICQCRTSILGIGVAITAYIFVRSKKKLKLTILIALVVLSLYYIPFTRNFINQALFLTKYAGTDLNTFSSGRIVKYIKALQLFKSSPYIGVGQYYVDCSYLLILVESGIIGFLIIEWIWINKLILSYRYKANDKYRVFLFMMTTFYIIESILEGYPPFGPGVSSFMYWFLSSVIINSLSNQNNHQVNALNKEEL
ncbi:MAG: O-antigen ligase family protein [Lachnospiraceae bacterium]|nr:O-antigen ligase family protein [Erysipelotrichaceae bacterium]MBR4342403.1 O-antigen ligase family protein [Lachnospiraceae bacterium]